MRIFTDSLFKIGSTHATCQDYALHGSAPFPYVVVSDGCSGAEHSDIGSRLLSHAVPQAIKILGEERIFKDSAEDIIARIYNIAAMGLHSMDLPEMALHATLLIAIASTKYDAVRVIMVGDGFLMLKEQDREQAVLKSDFDKDYPMYPSYIANMELMKRYEKAVADANQVYSQTWIQGAIPEKTLVRDTNYVTDLTFKLADLEWITLSSDGMDTFVDRESSGPVDTEENIVSRATQFKGLLGTFLSRRINKMLTKELKSYVHEDDFSIAGMSFIQESKS